MANKKPEPVRVLIFHASLRKASYNAKLAQLAADVVARTGGVVVRAAMSDFDCPSYNGDVESAGELPPGALRWRERLNDVDAFIIASPEYNGSMPGILKNAIDWTSRVRPQPFNGKQGLLMSASPSMAGGNRGVWSLRVPLEHLGARIYPDMFSLAQAHEAFDERGQLKNDVLRKRFDETLDCYLELVEAAKNYPTLKKHWVEFLGEQPNSPTDRVEASGPQAA